MIEKFLNIQHALFILAQNWTYAKSVFVDNFIFTIVEVIDRLSEDSDIRKFAYQEIINVLQQKLEENS